MTATNQTLPTQTAHETKTCSRLVRKTVKATVISAPGQKTIVGRVTTYIPHPIYHKRILRTKKYHIHDEENTAKLGDTVLIMETRPISKMKHFRLVKVLTPAPLT